MAMISSTEVKTTFRTALGAHLFQHNTPALVEALRALSQSPAQTRTTHMLCLRLIEALKAEGNESQPNPACASSPQLSKILGRFDRLLGQQAIAQTLTEKHRIDEQAQSLIAQLDAIGSQKQHPLAPSGSEAGLQASLTIDQRLLAPWPLTPHLKDHWVFEFGSDLALALPSSEVKALLNAPTLTPITAKEESLEGKQSRPELWGFSGVEWANTPLPVVALTPPPAYRRALGICVCVLQTPREVASDFSHFGLLCPSLPRSVSKEDITQNHHQFIDWVAVVGAIKERF